MALPPEPPLDVPDSPPTLPSGYPGISPALVELAETIKSYRQWYRNERSDRPRSAYSIKGLRPLSGALAKRLLREIQKDPDYKLVRTNPEAASAAQRNKAGVYDELLRGITEVHQNAVAADKAVGGRDNLLVGEEPTYAPALVPGRDPQEAAKDLKRAAGTAQDAAGEKVSREEIRDIDIAAFNARPGQAPHGTTFRASAPTVTPEETAAPKEETPEAEPDATPEVEEAPEAPKVEAAPISPEKAAPEEIPEAAAEVEGAPEAEEETVDDSTPDWIKELGEDDAETLNAYQRAQKERRAAVEKALAPKQEPIPTYDPSKPPRVEPIPTYDPDTDTARRVPVELSESQQPEEEEFGEVEIPEQPEAYPESFVPERTADSPIGIYGEPLTRQEGSDQWEPIDEVGEEEAPEDAIYRQSQQPPEEQYGESQPDEGPSGPSPEMSTPDARKAAVEKAMQPKQAARPQSIKAPQGARVIKGDGGWSYAVMPNKDIRIIGAPKGHSPGMLLKSGSKGPWSAIANKFGVVPAPSPEPTTKTEIKTTEPTSKTPKAGTKKKGVGAALKRLLSGNIDMPEDIGI